MRTSLAADLLADHQEGHGRQAVVQIAQHHGEHRAVAHAGVEQAQRRRGQVQPLQLVSDAFGDHLLLAAGGDEHQILLAVVEEAEGPLGDGLVIHGALRPLPNARPERGAAAYATRPWQCLNFLPEPQGQGLLRPTLPHGEGGRGMAAASCRAAPDGGGNGDWSSPLPGADPGSA